MKKLLSYCLMVLAAALPACTTDEPASDTPEINEESVRYIHRLAEGEESVSYKYSGMTAYRRQGSDTEWHKDNPNEYLGWELPVPTTITISQGRTWVPLELFHSAVGPHPVCMALDVYRRATGFDKTFYVATSVEYNSEEGLITIGNRECIVDEANGNILKIRMISPFITGNDIKGEWRYDLTYRCSAFTLPDAEKILWYESSLDAYLGIVKMLREYFGDSVDVNPYYYPDIVYDYDHVDFDELEQQIYDTISFWE